jgi:hypothetical protein
MWGSRGMGALRSCLAMESSLSFCVTDLVGCPRLAGIRRAPGLTSTSWLVALMNSNFLDRMVRILCWCPSANLRGSLARGHDSFKPYPRHCIPRRSQFLHPGSALSQATLRAELGISGKLRWRYLTLTPTIPASPLGEVAGSFPCFGHRFFHSVYR